MAAVSLASTPVLEGNGASNGAGLEVPDRPPARDERTPAQVEMGRLLARRHDLALKDDEASELEYVANSKRIRELEESNA
jgi:hypothetical protein